MAWPIRKQAWADIPETAPVKITLWGDLLEPNCAVADKTIRDAIVGRGDIRYEFRYFPFDQACNPALPRTVFPGLPRREGRRGRRATGRERDVLEDAHLDHGKPEGVRRCGAARGGACDGAERRGAAPEDGQPGCEGHHRERCGAGLPDRDPEIPRIFINGKLVPRWNIPNQFVIERLIDMALKPPAPAH